MATSNPKKIESYKTGGAIVANRLCKIGAADRTVIESTGITNEHLGVSLTSAEDADNVLVQQGGKCKAKGSGAITRGDKLMWATGGKVALAAGVTAKIVGVALASYADGDLVEFDATFPSITPLGA